MQVDIIIPIYKNTQLSRNCVRSIYNNIEEIKRYSPRVICLNDSPEDEETKILMIELHKNFQDIVILENKKNLGFVKTVNRALMMSRKRNSSAFVVNTDTVCYPGTLVEMLEVLQLDDQIGFVCPRSNNAALATFPKPPHGLSGVATSADVSFQAWNQVHEYLPRFSVTPTAVGFFLLIRDRVIANFGGLNEDFGMGYEEENDLVMRANKVGFIAVQANHAFAYHYGSASFKLTTSDVALRKAENFDKINGMHPEFIHLVRSYEASPEYLTEIQISNLVSDVDGRLKVALNLLPLGPYFNGTSELVLNALSALNNQQHPKLDFEAICTEEVARFFNLSRFGNIAVKNKLSKRYAIAVCFGQPFDLHTLNCMEVLAPIHVYGMLDVIAYDCGYLRSTMEIDRFWKFISRTANGMFFISDYARSTFMNRFGSMCDAAQYTRLLPTAVKRNPGHTRRRHILVVGNHFAHKDSARVSYLLSESFPEVQIINFGREELEVGNIKTVASGFLSAREVERLFSDASVVVLPSFYEGFGLSFLNAMAFGKPIIARSIPVLSEILPNFHFKDGLFLFDDDASLIASLPKAISAEKLLYDVISSNTWEEWTGGLLDFFMTLFDKDKIYSKSVERLEYGDLMRKAKHHGGSLRDIELADIGFDVAASDSIALSYLIECDNETFIERLYKKILLRSPDREGVDTYTRLLDQGSSRETIINSVLASQEFFQRGLDKFVVLDRTR